MHDAKTIRELFAEAQRVGRLEHGAAGRAVRMAGFGQDITTSVLLERERIQRSRMETMGLLAGGIAHDFNNILSVVLGHAGLLASELPFGARAGRRDRLWR